MFKEILAVMIGFAFLVGGADILIRGSCKIARILGVSILVVGLTVVAFGTSAPELFVSVTAAMHGTADVAVGNIIGSNLFNILIIIGISALIGRVKISKSILKREMPIMIVVLALFVLFSLGMTISRLEGIILFAGIFAYLYMNYRTVRKDKLNFDGIIEPEDPTENKTKAIWTGITFIALGLVGLVFGSELVVANAVSIARHWGVSDLIIAVTLVAVGTSLPELATTVMAAIKGEPDLAVGNAVGSNIFNVLCVIGLVSIITPLTVAPSALRLDLPFMLIACALVWPLMIRRKSLGRPEGLLMMCAYGFYIYLIFSRQA